PSGVHEEPPRRDEDEGVRIGRVPGTGAHAGTKSGARTDPSTPVKVSGRNTARTGMPKSSAAGSQSTMRVGMRTSGSSSTATSAGTNGVRSANWGRKAWVTTTQENRVPVPRSVSQVNGVPSHRRHVGSGYHRSLPQVSQRGRRSSSRAAPAPKSAARAPQRDG